MAILSTTGKNTEKSCSAASPGAKKGLIFISIMDSLSQEQKEKLRQDMADLAGKLIGIPYHLAAEWTDYTQLPRELDCSELVEGVYKAQGLKMEDGSQNQFDCTTPTASPQLMDLVFLGKGGDPQKVYHVGLLYHMGMIIEARAHDPNAKFTTGRVILRPKQAWENYKPNFLGYRVQAKLSV